VYLPGFSVTDQVWLPVPLTDVFLFTPGPNRWTLWIEDLSRTLIVYFPAPSVVTAFPAAVLTEIVKPGPLTPTSFGVARVLA
jgi:hypothetical protein